MNSARQTVFLRLLFRLTLLCLPLALVACVTHNETVYRDAERTPVEFENDKAARVFYEELARSPESLGDGKSTTVIELPLIMNSRRTVVSSRNLIFNNAVRLCDTNQDGLITEMEALIFVNNRKSLEKLR